MRTSIFGALALSIILVGFSAHAAIDLKFLKDGCQKGTRTSWINDGAWVESTAICANGDGTVDQLLELAVANHGWEKEIYIYDQGVELGSKTLKATYAQDVSGLYSGPSGTALYIGKRYSGYDVFVVRLAKRPRPAASLDIYIKMGGNQVRTTNVKVIPW
jgi:hypothetical protein